MAIRVLRFLWSDEVYIYQKETMALFPARWLYFTMAVDLFSRADGGSIEAESPCRGFFLEKFKTEPESYKKFLSEFEQFLTRGDNRV